MKKHCDQILKRLKSGKTITQDQAREDYGCARLAARIHELRQDGHKIATTMVPGERSSFARYSYVRGRRAA